MTGIKHAIIVFTAGRLQALVLTSGLPELNEAAWKSS